MSQDQHDAGTGQEMGQDFQYIEPTPEQIAERAQRANRATRGALAATLCLESLTVLLVPRAIAQTSTGLSGGKTAFLVGLAVVLFLVACLLRRPWGIGAGSAGQAVLLATAVLAPAFLVVGVFFVAVWVWILHTRHQLVGTPSGWRMFIS
jgi:hypothetical protein